MTATRRRFLSIAAAAGGMLCAPVWASNRPPIRWHGHALGGAAEMVLHGVDHKRGEQAVAMVMREVARLEKDFSLFDDRSAIRRLNRDGQIGDASIDFRRVLACAGQVYKISEGAFDITVQPLWENRREGVRGFDHIVVDGTTVRFDAAAMAITLNGIAQGYITDRINDLLRDDGFANVLVNMGEIRALGPRGDGAPWRVARPGGQVIGLADGALATSQQSTPRPHLFNPQTGVAVAGAGSVSVAAPTAMIADALSTAFAVMSRGDALRIAATRADVRVWFDDTPMEETL